MAANPLSIHHHHLLFQQLNFNINIITNSKLSQPYSRQSFKSLNPLESHNRVFDFVSHESDFFGTDATKKAEELKVATIAKNEANKKAEKRL
ncbi:hypothetical protein PIB30_006514 [Stylosanthes scabra]|uniref:Uncharacterized protein n=1 Tax=Stylosanthes scabra TaxID=79078 RepID=A0ABU6W3U0_9FABA|nr:hypothetical protein [Stylosanthes scabra]